jgi:hypothetical protein
MPAHTTMTTFRPVIAARFQNFKSPRSQILGRIPVVDIVRVAIAR